MRQFLEDWKTIGVEIIGALGFGLWASQANWDWEPSISACMFGFALVVSLFMRIMPRKEKTTENQGKTNVTSINQTGGQTAHTIINRNIKA